MFFATLKKYKAAQILTLVSPFDDEGLSSVLSFSVHGMTRAVQRSRRIEIRSGGGHFILFSCKICRKQKLLSKKAILTENFIGEVVTGLRHFS